jgi:hypothetical protein
LITEAIENPVRFGQRHKQDIETYSKLADLQLVPFEEAREPLLRALDSDDPWQRYWALITASAHGNSDAELSKKTAELARNDTEPLVRARAAEFLCLTAGTDPMPTLMAALKASRTGPGTNLILNTLVLLRDHSGRKLDIEISNNDLGATDSETSRRLRYLNGDEFNKKRK